MTSPLFSDASISIRAHREFAINVLWGSGKRIRPIQAEKLFVHFLYQIPIFGALDDFDDFVESISCESSKTCQVCGSNPCRGATF
jgi:hypothetical protein